MASDPVEGGRRGVRAPGLAAAARERREPRHLLRGFEARVLPTGAGRVGVRAGPHPRDPHERDAADDFVGLVGVFGMIVLLGRRVAGNLSKLARLEPPNVVKPPPPGE